MPALACCVHHFFLLRCRRHRRPDATPTHDGGFSKCSRWQPPPAPIDRFVWMPASPEDPVIDSNRDAVGVCTGCSGGRNPLVATQSHNPTRSNITQRGFAPATFDRPAPSTTPTMSDYEEEPQFDDNGAAQGEASSALEESILRKGKNSYYYAHSKKLGAWGVVRKRLAASIHR